jgi:predicted dithiol-disulfide oxidoreductase (DUF899 family)
MSELLTSTRIQNHEVVSSEQWTTARNELLRKDKEFTRLRDELSQQRRELPWEKVEKQYVFDQPTGKVTLADHFDGSLVHLANRDVTLAVVSRAPMD